MTQRHKGFSLIEVAIAMVIFVIGALAILRIFPTGLGLVEKSGNAQLATNSDRSVLAALRNADAVPDAVFDGGFSNASAPANLQGWTEFNGSVSGSARYNNTLPKSVRSTDLTNSALDKFRSIRGEKAVVRSGNAGLYALTQFSIDPALTTNVYREDEVQDATIDENGNVDLSNASLKSGKTFSKPTTAETNRIFYISYRYKPSTAANERIWGESDEPTYAGASGAIQVRLRPLSKSIVGPVSVRVRELTTPGVSFSTDELAAKARCGIIVLPSTYSAGETISLDYTTDWYWILETLTPSATADSVFVPVAAPTPTPGPGPTATPVPPAASTNLRQVELSLPFVRPRTSKRFAAVLMDGGGTGTHYTSAYLPTGLTGYPTTPKVVFPNSGTTDEAKAADASNLRNALREGKIAFDVTGITQPLARVAYRTQDDWVRQLSVSAKSYKRFYAVTPQFEQWRDYASNGNDIFFHASEAGKSVNVTYSYGSTSDPKDDTTVTELLVIGSDIQSSNLLGATALSAVKLTLAPPTGNNVTSIQSIKGASITARTAWMTNDKYSQSVVTSMRGDS